MEPRNCVPSPSQAFAEPPRRVECPACGGALVPLRGSWRCSRCSFALCEGCEGGSENDFDGDPWA